MGQVGQVGPTGVVLRGRNDPLVQRVVALQNHRRRHLSNASITPRCSTAGAKASISGRVAAEAQGKAASIPPRCSTAGTGFSLPQSGSGSAKERRRLSCSPAAPGQTRLLRPPERKVRFGPAHTNPPRIGCREEEEEEDDEDDEGEEVEEEEVHRARTSGSGPRRTSRTRAPIWGRGICCWSTRQSPKSVRHSVPSISGENSWRSRRQRSARTARKGTVLDKPAVEAQYRASGVTGDGDSHHLAASRHRLFWLVQSTRALVSY